MSNVRYRDGGWEMRCDECRAKRGGAYWPLTAEFWDTHNMARCRACTRERRRVYERGHAPKRAYMARYRELAREAIRIKNQIYYATNRERLNAYNRAYRAANRDRVLTLQRDRYRRQKAAA